MLLFASDHADHTAVHGRAVVRKGQIATVDMQTKLGRRPTPTLAAPNCTKLATGLSTRGMTWRCATAARALGFAFHDNCLSVPPHAPQGQNPTPGTWHPKHGEACGRRLCSCPQLMA